MNCKCGLEMILEPVPGAVQFPKRLSCPSHGYPKERSTFLVAGTEQDKPNDYLTELASPADIIMEDEGDVVDSRY